MDAAQGVPVKPVLVHLVSRFLPRSETFTYRLIRNTPGFDHHVLTHKIENADLFPFSPVTVVSGEEAFIDYARQVDAAAIVGHFGPMGFSGLPAALACGVPLAAVFHGYDVSMLLADPAWRERYRAMFALGGHAVCISHHGRRRLLEIGCPEAQATTLHLGVDMTEFAPKTRIPRGPHEPLRLLSVARLAEKKGLATAILAVAKLRAHGVTVSLRIVGEGEHLDRLTALRGMLNLQRFVTFVGALDTAGVRRELDDADVFLMPSVTAKNGDEEGIPVVLMEAMAAGVPVVASRHAGIPELVAHERTGLLIDESDVDALATAVARYGERPAFARDIAAAARAFVEQEFNIATQGAAFSSLLHRLIETPVAGHQRPAPRRRMLFMRSVPVSVALSKLLVLSHRYPDAEFWVLTREDSPPVFTACPQVSRVLSCSAGRLVITGLTPETHLQLLDTSFERVFVPSSSQDDANVVEIAQRCRAGAVIRLLPNNDEMIVGPPLSEAVAS